MLTEFALAHEPLVRVTAFILTLAAMVLWEIRAPRRDLVAPKLKRWRNNLSLLLMNVLIVRILFPAAAVGFAAFAQTHQMGLLQMIAMPDALVTIAAILLLDLAIYLQHLVFHAVSPLWRLHRVHHADLDFDATTGTRFHPIEVLLSMGIKFLIIVTLGPPVIAVLIFETLLNVMAMFNHSNISMPNQVDRILRGLLVTPDMHRVHHSIDCVETNANFGFCFSFWDRLLGTYKPAPALGHTAMTIGIPEFRDPNDVINLQGMLVLPLGVVVPLHPSAPRPGKH